MSHVWSRPEGDEEAEQKGMPDNSVEPSFLEHHRCVLPSSETEENLPQSEEVEVMDREGAIENKAPTKREEESKNESTRRVLDMPYDPGHGLPFPEEQEQQQTIPFGTRRFSTNPIA